ncbi:CubicO group peptidase (beta-lactamase class C family) [Branchiibius hedensis]|uniref:CubicO group peptidase, beta-lactamase class C family n=1 Tax=Branchiibius hedensis TaxID=672460 RepID=A0A2Y8ZTV5_9MICO|nr:serine hydrolase domain-containing protein [Branchiibius hedensis]PWJ27030.1 CubicO group peptidase (beta-lactamase class C family) [Branchiibius hedensis]SSA35841.1 CubicO group peptidase, beta-lactamase class C family [Branchiibius hedensis]
MVEGDWTARFAPLADLLARNLQDGTDVGAAVAVVLDGELVVDAWGGQAQPGVSWQRDTIVQVWSVTKTMAALAVLALVDDDRLDLDAPVARYWPAFGAHGKDAVIVRQVLGHASGVPGWDRKVTVDDLVDLQLTESWLADVSPWYQAGSAPAYQLVNHGHLLDGIVRNALGRTLAQVIDELVLEPTGNNDFFLGVPDEALMRCADLVPPPPSNIDYSALPAVSFLLRTMTNPLLPATVCNSVAWRRSEVGAAAGHGNARGVALAQSAITCGSGGLLSEATVRRIFDVQAEGIDLVLGAPVRYGVGFGLPMTSAPAVPDGRVCWWTGYGGAIVVNDVDRRMTFAYTPNSMANHLISSPRTDEYVRTAFACLDPQPTA